MTISEIRRRINVLQRQFAPEHAIKLLPRADNNRHRACLRCDLPAPAH